MKSREELKLAAIMDGVDWMDPLDPLKLRQRCLRA
jgi:hypothetical protein